MYVNRHCYVKNLSACSRSKSTDSKTDWLIYLKPADRLKEYDACSVLSVYTGSFECVNIWQTNRYI